MSTPLVLVLDDEQDIRELIQLALKKLSLDVLAVETVQEAQSALKAHPIALCLTDMRLPDGDGLSLIDWMQSQCPEVPVAMMTAYGNIELAVKALQKGAFDFVTKPMDLSDLRELVQKALSSVREPLPQTEQGLIGQAPAMQALLGHIAKVSRTQAPIFIHGESGSGKELVARMIHASGPRQEGPFVPVNCGAISEHLMESEFFGHRKGSFTGASADKQGLFQAASGGTLFLDEIADLPLHMQVKLLRAIQEKSVKPVGAQKEERVDVRILSATHRDLSECVQSGTFREDLFYRLHVIALRVPPLRERLEDLPELTQFILEKLSQRHEAPKPTLSSEAVACLVGHAFPGNVRELENILERAFVLCHNQHIEKEDFCLLETDKVVDRPEVALESMAEEDTTDLQTYLEAQERAYLQKVLAEHDGQKTKAAQQLGLTVRALRYRLQKVGLTEEKEPAE